MSSNKKLCVVSTRKGYKECPNKPAIDLKVWLADLTYTQMMISAPFIPQAIGSIAAFAMAEADFAEPIRLFKYPESLLSAMDEKDGAPDVIGFSYYLWNSDMVLVFADSIKRKFPETIVVLGGPNYSLDREEQIDFLKNNRQIDFFIPHYGEGPFSALIQALAASGGSKEPIHGTLPSVHSVDGAGAVHLTGTMERIKDLGRVPSAYTSGILDPFFDGYLSPIIQFARGCPFGCTFCVEGQDYYRKVNRFPMERVVAELWYVGRRMEEVRKTHGRNDLFVADSNFGMYREDLEICRHITEVRNRYGWPEYINVATGKENKHWVLETARLLKGTLRISGSVQSLDTRVLENIKRKNISPKGMMDLALEAVDTGANSYCEIILGLPGDSKEAHFSTLRQVINAGFNLITNHQLIVIPGTEIGTSRTKEDFALELRYRVFPRCFGVYEINGEQAPIAEIEEVCVGGRELPFEDYLACRCVHLIIAIFYNDGIFAALLHGLRHLGLDLFDWILALAEAPKTAGLEEIFRRFTEDTVNELWTNPAELRRHLRDADTVQRYIDGKMGKNILMTCRAMAIINHIEELAEVARGVTLDLLREKGLLDDSVAAFVTDAIQYQTGRCRWIFKEFDRVNTVLLVYDILRFEREAARNPAASFTDFKLERPRRYEFVLSDEQKRKITSYLRTFGSSFDGIAMALTKVYVKELFRKAVPVEPD